MNVSAGAVAGHRDIVDGILPELAGSVSAVLDRLVSQASDLLLGAVTGPEPAVARPALEDTLSPLRVALAGLGRAAADIGAPGGATATRSVTSGAPTLVTVVATPEAPAGLAKVRVLSVAASGTAVTAQTFTPDEALGDGTERTIGLVQHLGTSKERTTVIDVGRYPTITQLAQSINQANVAVRATVASIGSGGVQLHITSLSSGRSSSVTIVNGEDPPTTSAILGRVVPLVSGRDTLLEVQRPGETAALTQSTGRLVRGVLPGVDVEVRSADPGRTFHVGTQRLSAPTLDRATDLVARAAAVVSSAQVAGASATASRVLSALGLAPAETVGGTGALGLAGGALSGLGAGLTGGVPVGGTPEDGVDGSRAPLGFPGVRRDESGLPAVNRQELAAAFDRDARGTQAQLSVSARALAGVAANADAATWEAYAAARAAQGPDRFALYSPPQTQQTRDGEQGAHTLTRQEEALRAVLGRLQDQGAWLGAQLF